MMKRNEQPITVAEAAKITKELSPNMRAKLQKWMALGILNPQFHAPARKNQASLLSKADVVVVVILHWLFSCGVRFRNVSGGLGADFQFDVPPERMFDFLPPRGRTLQLLLDAFQFDFIVVTFPIVAEQIPVGPPEKRAAILSIPNRKPGEPFYVIHVVRTGNIEEFRSRYAPDWRTVPRIEIAVKPIYDQVCDRWPV